MRALYCALLLACSWAFSFRSFPCQAGSIDAGPLYDDFELTLAPGHRTEIVAPLFYYQHKETEKTWAFPPLMSYTIDPELNLLEFDFCYPILTYDRYGSQYRWQFLQIFSFSGGPTQTETNRDRSTFFPFYFHQHSTDPTENYTAVFPFYGTLKHRLFRDEIFFAMWPLYVQTRKRDVVTENYLVPFFDVRHGDGLSGWQLWPLVGDEHKDPTTRTNLFGDIEPVPGHDKFFALWPLFYHQTTGIGSTNQDWQQGFLPLYALERSPNRDSTTFIWPFFSRVDDREKKYKEWDAPWPFIVFARGEGKNTSRVFPFFSNARSPTLESDFYLWPVYKQERIHSPPLERERTRILFFLASDIKERSTETGRNRRRTDVWPLFTHQRDLDGNTRLQLIAPLEIFVIGSHKIERDYSPLWSVWRSEKNAKTGARSQSLLWNLYRHESSPDRAKTSALFGLFQYRRDADGKHLRLCYISLGRKPTEKPPAP